MPDDTVLLERHFDTAFSAPNGVQKLRELILTFAMQGKLVPQDPNDQPAGELLKAIETEKQRLVKEGQIKQHQTLPQIKLEDIAYELPQGWEWVRLGEVTSYNGRKNINSEAIAPETWLLDLEDIEKDTSRVIYRAKYSERQSKSTKSTFEKGDVLYGKLRPYLNKVVVADAEGVCTTEIVPIVPLGGIDSQFLKWLLKRPSFLAHVNTLMYGVKMPRLGTHDAIISVHPLPPLNEQRRIVARIDRLMAQCDELENLGGDRNQKRITVHTVAINRLLAAKEDSDFSTAWNFLKQHFGELYSVKENVAELRKAILQLAVMGKLVPQDPNDQPASELLRAIGVEKQSLVGEGKIKKAETFSLVDNAGISSEIPSSWQRARIETICEVIVDCPHSTPKFIPDGITCIDTNSFKSGAITHHKLRYVSEETYLDRIKRLIPQTGDVIFAREGSVGESVVIPQGMKCCLGQRVMLFRPGQGVLSRYLQLSMSNQLFLTRLLSAYKGIGAKHVNVKDMRNALISLPPLQEQHRIIAKIDQLMALCDRLEQQIDAATNKRTELLNALMAQV